MARDPIKPRRCPKCGGLPDEYVEMWCGHNMTYPADAEGRPAAEGFLHPGDPQYVLATCRDCAFEWRLRGVLQITAIETSPIPDLLWQ